MAGIGNLLTLLPGPIMSRSGCSISSLLQGTERDADYNPACSPEGNVSSTMISCFGADDGTISITGATGGSGSYQYSVNGGDSWRCPGNFTGLRSGSYDVRIRDAAHTCL